MCLITFAFQHHEKFPLIVCANRDEQYQRPSLPAHFWPENPQIYAGQDLKAGGTWLGLNINGRFAAITNFRSNTAPKATAKSRGALCIEFLNSMINAREYLNKINLDRDQYTGFNLIVGNAKELLYYSSQQAKIINIMPGIHGLSNGFLNEEWPKLKDCKTAMRKVLNQSTDQQKLFEILQDDKKAEDQLLPNTGVDINIERLLSSRFIRSPEYGTRNSTVLMIDNNHQVKWLEQNFDNDGPIAESKSLNFQLTQ